MAIRLFITSLLLFHQISSSIQQSDQVDPSISPHDRDEILSGDRRTLNSKKDCPDTVRLGSCRRELNETQQELIEARGKICGLKTEIQCEQKERSDEFTKINSKISQSDDRSTRIGADLKEIQLERENQTAEIVKLRADLNRKMTRVLDLNGGSYLAKTASWYKAFDHHKTFDEAEAYCASRKSHLVSIHSQEENDFVQKLAKTVYSMEVFWIGLKVEFLLLQDGNMNKGNAFEWTDGSLMDFINWYPSYPYTDTHAELRSHNGKWLAYSSTNQWYFICKRSSL